SDFDNTWINARDSFYWSPQCFSQLSTFQQRGDFNDLTLADYNLARLHHWLLQRDLTTLSHTISLERGPSPDGVQEGFKQWYEYWGKDWLVGTNCAGQSATNRYSEGTNGHPRFIASVL